MLKSEWAWCTWTHDRPLNTLNGCCIIKSTGRFFQVIHSFHDVTWSDVTSACIFSTRFQVATSRMHECFHVCDIVSIKCECLMSVRVVMASPMFTACSPMFVCWCLCRCCFALRSARLDPGRSRAPLFLATCTKSVLTLFSVACLQVVVVRFVKDPYCVV